MTDTVTQEKRSEIMSHIRSKNTGPEMVVRKLLHSAGYRYRLHRKDLPGKPDLVLAKYHTAIFVHGCFWHRHDGCANAVMPKSRPEFWSAKLSGNVRRDGLTRNALISAGWRVLVVWECACRREGKSKELLSGIESFLDNETSSYREIGASDLDAQ